MKNRHLSLNLNQHQLLFDRPWNHILTSILQGVIGQVWVDNMNDPRSALAIVGHSCQFAFLGGQVDQGLLEHTKQGEVIVVPCSPQWSDYFHTFDPQLIRGFTRYAMQVPQSFDRSQLISYTRSLPEPYQLRLIDETLYYQCLSQAWSRDLVGNYPTYGDFASHGKGYLVMNDQEILSGAGSFLPIEEGIEIEVDTHPDYRGLGLATVAVAQIILSCIDCSWYPSWDAHTEISRDFAKKFGYSVEFDYRSYEWLKSE